MIVDFNLNEKDYMVDVPPDMRALDLIRDVLRLTGVKEGCGRGECGACTILVNGKPFNSCLLYAVKLNGKKVLTIEGLAQADGSLHPLQEAFLNEGAVQCGYCTPGMILSAKALLDENPSPEEEEIEEALSGNICRCTGYKKIVTAVKAGAKVMREKV
ncbi:MAG: (2Fe-2S)-binding protein [Spirochaetes bacterium]|nr:MAG: (2Fe-2S)-binding protein [Spirochaetota bacterium]